MNKRGQLGDILEFKVGLVILILLIILSVILFNVSSVVNFFNGELSVSERVLSLQEEKIYQDLLVNYLKKDNLGDLITSKNLENADKILEKDKSYYLLVFYPDEEDNFDKDDLTLNYIYLDDSEDVEEFFLDALSRTIIPTFDGKSIIEIGLVEIEDE